MKILTVCISLLFIVAIADAQVKFASVNASDLMQKYPDTLAMGSLVLFDNTQINELSEVITFKRHVRIKVTNKERFLWSMPFNYLKSIVMQSDLTRFKAWSYVLDNGKVVKEKISKDAILNGSTMSNGSVVYETGSIIEYTYLTTSPYESESIQLPVVSLDPLADRDSRARKRYSYFAGQQFPHTFFSRMPANHENRFFIK